MQWQPGRSEGTGSRGRRKPRFGVPPGYGALGRRPEMVSDLRKRAQMPTAEYSVGTLGACTVGGVLVKIGQSEWFGDLVKGVIDNIPDLLPF